MRMSPNLRKLTLSLHITLSVGWIGAVLAYLALVIAAMRSQDVQALRAAWLAMGSIGRFIIVPLAVAALLTGLVMALGTKWGLLRHYWVLISLGLTVLATAVLVAHMPTVTFFAGLAARTDSANVGRLRAGLGGELFHAGLGLLVLLVVQALNVYKPQGLTPWAAQAARTT
ncbi:MAG: DUF2269 domain-containing protein [Candidatus Promineifilaceae bacterium]